MEDPGASFQHLLTFATIFESLIITWEVVVAQIFFDFHDLGGLPVILHHVKTRDISNF